MFATFKCDFCNEKIIANFNDSTKFPSNCPKCDSPFSHSQYIPSFGEKLYSLNRVLKGLTFCGLTNGDPSSTYKSDMNSLESLYTHTSEETKELLIKILDLNFLIIYHDAKSEDIEKLKDYIYTLESIHENKIELGNKKLLDLLNASDD